MAGSIKEGVDAVRGFNRFYTNLIGALRRHLLGTPYSLTEARVVYELAQRNETDAADLRLSLDIDAGYLSRILAGFESAGLVRRRRSRADGRRRVIRLTARGRAAFRTLDARAAAEVRALLSRLDDRDQGRLVGAMTSIRAVLEGHPRSSKVSLRAPRPGDLGWVVHRHGAVYAAEFGWDETFEALVARIVADYMDRRDPKREAAWIAQIDGERVGSVFCTRRDGATAQLRLLLVEPHVRGRGVGGRLVDECLRFAKRAGYDQIVLWTNDVLVDARRIYERAGFTLAEEEPHRSFGHDLVGQTWKRPL